MLAGLLAPVGFVIAGWVRGTTPWGPVSRNVNDLGNQLVPFNALLWDVVHREGPSTWSWNWSGGLGVPFLPDYATYLADPTSLLVALFPRDRVELAVYLVTLLRVALAGALMTAYLRVIRPRGPAGWAVVLGVGYASCGWMLDDASYMPMWLSGLWALPALALVGEWSRARRRWALGALVAGLCWWSNFYTAYMATIGAGLLLLARVLAEPGRWVVRLRALVGYAARVALGVGLAAGLLWPTYLAIRRAQPGTHGWLAPADPRTMMARLLPMTEGLGTSPSLYVGTAALVAALTLPLNGRQPWRIRVVYPVGVLALLASMQWPRTQLLWNAGTAPNGGSFRAAFVACGAIVVTAWVATAGPSVPVGPGEPGTLSQPVAPGEPVALNAATPSVATPGKPRAHRHTGLRAWQLAVAGLAVGGGALIARGAPTSQVRVDPAMPCVAAASAGVVAVLLFAALSGSSAPDRQSRMVSSVAIALVGLLMVAEGAATAVVVDRERATVLYAWPAWQPNAALAHQRAVAAMSRWPMYRTGGTRVVGAGANRSALVGYPGLTYYSSVMPAATSAAVSALGVPWSGWGRSIDEVSDPGLDPLLAVGTRVIRAADPPVRLAAVPLVRVMGPAPLGTTPAAGSPYVVRNELAGAPIYAAPRVVVSVPGHRPQLLSGGLSIRTPRPVTLWATCPAGWTPQMWAPAFAGTWHAGGHTGVSSAPTGRRAGDHGAAGMVTLPITERAGTTSAKTAGRASTAGRAKTAGRARSAGRPTAPRRPTAARRRRTAGPAASAKDRPAGIEPVRVELVGSEHRVTLPARPIGCLNASLLNRLVARANAEPPTLMVDGATIEATWTRQVTGRVVIATTAQPGWSCQSDGTAASTGAGNASGRTLGVVQDGRGPNVGSVGGLLSTPVRSAQRLQCEFDLPGQRTGVSVAILCALILLILALF